jgi:hypothetical protein
VSLVYGRKWEGERQKGSDIVFFNSAAGKDSKSERPVVRVPPLAPEVLSSWIEVTMSMTPQSQTLRISWVALKAIRSEGADSRPTAGMRIAPEDLAVDSWAWIICLIQGVSPVASM